MVQQAGGYPQSPMHQQAPPTPQAPPQAAPAPAAPAPAANAAPVQPLSKAEYDELMGLEAKWLGLSDGTGVMDPKDMHRYAALSDRYQALKVAGVAPQ
jgi:hypothetical protein